ncbi:MAG: relaxase domain-containing protein, partial [bacterium]|nr:relaxase domain-containing protein [bacterium]
MVATVTRLSEAASTVHYFEADGYYAKNDPEHRKASGWHGGGVTALGLHGPVKPLRFEQILSGHVPGTKTRLGRLRDGKHEHRPGLDVTFSAPKSVSLEALVHARPKTGAKIVRAHDEAVKSTLDFIENELLDTRGWDPVTRRRPRVKGHGLVAATFRHYASRNLDPQLHTHSVIANMTQNEEGAWRSADFIKIERSKLLIGAFYRHELKRRIEALGYATTQTMVGSVPGFEIAGYSKQHLKAFSTRREEALKWAKEKNLDANASVMQQAVLYTRKRKEEPSRRELARLWKARTGEMGLERDWTTARGRSHATAEDARRERLPFRLDRARWNRRRDGAPAGEPQQLSVLFAVRRAVEHLEERKTVFTAAMLRALVLGSGPWSLPEIDRAIAKLVADGHLVEARAHRSDLAFVTDRAVKAEKAVLAWMKDYRTDYGLEIPPEAVDIALDASPLNTGQRAAVRMLLLPGSRLVGVQGHAGTGKTAMLSEVVALAGEENVIGLAPSSSAALTLGRETGLCTRTLQWLLTRYRDVGDGTADDDAIEGARAALSGRLLVVDEASLVSMGQMDALLRIADASSVARVALVGDRRQLRAVEAGQPFRVLQDAGMETAVMDEVLRQRDSGLKQAVMRMIEGKPGLALETLGPGVLEMPADELGDHAAALWLDLDEDAREGTRILAPTHARRREINHGVRAGLKAEGSLTGRTLNVERYVNLHLTRSQKGDIGNWHEGDMVVFHHDVYGARARKGDACRITGHEDGHVLFDHPDGKPRKGDPSGYLRYHVDLFETDEIELQAGERIRWTRNDRERSLLNGEEARVLSIGHKNVKIATADGRELLLAHDDPQLHFIDHAYSSTVHAAQGITCDAVIAVLDADHGSIGGQAAFYVELTRARDHAVLLTDDRDGLVEALETAQGDELSALEAIGGQFRDEKPRVDVEPRPDLADDALEKIRTRSLGVETMDAVDGHLLRRLDERRGLQDAAGGGALASVAGYAAWREKTAAALDAMREASGRIDGTAAAEELRLLLDFDDGVRIVEERLYRLVAETGDAGETLALHPDFKDLAQLAVVMEAEAPLSARLTADLAALPGLYEEVTGAPLPDPFIADDGGVVIEEGLRIAATDVTPVTMAAEDPSAAAVAESTAEAAEMHDDAGLSPDASDEAPAAPAEPSPDVAAERLGALITERRAMIAEADGRLLSSLATHAGWRERALAAVDDWRRAAGDDGEDHDDAARLGRAVERDGRMADLARRLAAHEAAAKEAGDDPMAGVDTSFLALDCIDLALQARLDG